MFANESCYRFLWLKYWNTEVEKHIRIFARMRFFLEKKRKEHEIIEIHYVIEFQNHRKSFFKPIFYIFNFKLEVIEWLSDIIYSFYMLLFTQKNSIGNERFILSNNIMSIEWVPINILLLNLKRFHWTFNAFRKAIKL